MAAVGKACGNMFQLAQGNSAETSGGLLICLPREQAAAYCKDIQKVEGYQAWIIGIVEKGNRLEDLGFKNCTHDFIAELLASLTNLGSLKCQPRRRRVNCGKCRLSCRFLGLNFPAC